ncbi:hypothetical protein LCGC14_1159430 [marine sediment metagenome]|uniref:NarG-like domain-containing protein n=1 Tax=marine sediment metagenome TaxID=412755 RepID=A0A0F9PYS9_9ZZZZ
MDCEITDALILNFIFYPVLTAIAWTATAIFCRLLWRNWVERESGR